MTDRWERVGRLFDQLATAAPADRERQLDAEPDADDVKSEVRSLLAAHDRAEGFLESSQSPPADAALPDSASEAPLLAVGTAVGPYRIRGIAGRGGMGVVYDAEDSRLHRRVALKALPTAFAGDDAQRRRLRQEARAAAALQHPGIATVYALEEIDGGLFIASEFLEGETLRAEIARGPLPPEHALATAADLARALCAAHDRGVVHRDLKPENIVRTRDGGLKILDFGLAQFDDGGTDPMSRTRLTQQGLVVGTPAYMAPEQLLGQPTDFRVDHFALGVMLYEFCTGIHPFGDRSLPSTIARILAAPPYPPPATSHLPAGAWSIVERCVQKNAADRFASTRDLLAAIERAALPTTPITIAAAPSPVTPQLAASGAIKAEPSPPADLSAALRWWRFHQFAAALAYWAMVWPAWHVHRSLGRGGLFFFLATLAAVVVAGNLRLHLWFSSRVYPQDLQEQRREVARWIRWADVAFVALLIGGGIALPDEHTVWTAVFISYAIGSAIAFTVIEPATARAAFRES